LNEGQKNAIDVTFVPCRGDERNRGTKGSLGQGSDA